MDGFLTDLLFITTRARAGGALLFADTAVETFLFSLTP